MAEQIELAVHVARDGETGRWYVADCDIPGLRLEAGSAAELIGKIEQAAPEMIELNAVEIIGRHREARDRRARPRLTYRPVFDTALAASA